MVFNGVLWYFLDLFGVWWLDGHLVCRRLGGVAAAWNLPLAVICIHWKLGRAESEQRLLPPVLSERGGPIQHDIQNVE